MYMTQTQCISTWLYFLDQFFFSKSAIFFCYTLPVYYGQIQYIRKYEKSNLKNWIFVIGVNHFSLIQINSNKGIWVLKKFIFLIFNKKSQSTRNLISEPFLSL